MSQILIAPIISIESIPDIRRIPGGIYPETIDFEEMNLLIRSLKRQAGALGASVYKGMMP
jgi:hypothetical protein